jgi:4-amino-4-deoxy-L-arabinose transferase-like glycosyltransferase
MTLALSASEIQQNGKLQCSGWIALFAITFLGLVLRLYSLNASDFRLDADEAIVGLMAKHIAEGKAFPVFYYGQHYMGTLESLVIAGGFWLFGISSSLVKFVPLVFSVALIPLMFALAALLKSQRAGFFAALVTALPPSALVVWGSMARGGFIEVIVLGTLAFIYFIQFLKHPSKKLSYLGVTGLCCGLGWWVNNQIIFFMLPIGLHALLALRSERVPIRTGIHWLLVGCVAFVLGGAAYWAYNLQNGFISFAMLGGAGSGTSIKQHFSGFVFESLPILLGARRFWQTADLFPFAFALSALLYGGLLLVWLWSQRPALVLFCRGYVHDTSIQILLGTFLVAVVAVFVCSSFGHLSVAPRYVLPAYVGIFAITAIALDSIAVSSGILASLLLAGVVGVNLASTFWNGIYIPGEPIVINYNRVQKDHGEIIALLDNLNISWIKTDYWIGNRIAFETEERVKPLPFGEHKDCRVPEYCERAKDEAANRLVPYLLVPDQVRSVVTALAVQGIRHKVAHASGYTLVFDLSTSDEPLSKVPSTTIAATASSNVDAAHLAVDGDVTTRWGSNARQSSDMFFRLTFKQPQLISGLRYSLGSVPHDYPRKLRVVVTLEDGSQKEVLSPGQYSSSRYVLSGDGEFQFLFDELHAEAITLYQVGHDSIFDWSIAELEVVRRAN